MEDQGDSIVARRTVLGLFVGGAATLLAGCGLRGGNHYRFKMTAEVDTPQGLRTGSSVYEVEARSKAGLDPSGNVREKKLHGEAVAVDLPGGKTVFALLKTINPLRDDLALMSMAALDPAFRNDWVESAQRIAANDGIRSPAEVPPSDYPLLVTFRDIADPASVERVDPTNLVATFGAGYVLRKISVQTTKEPVTSGILQKLPWLPNAYDMLRGKDFRPKGIPLGNFKGLFSTELS